MRTQGQPNMNGDVYEGEFEDDEPRNGSTALATVRGPNGAGKMQTRTQYSTAIIAQVPRDLASTSAKGDPLPNTVLAKVLREAAIAGEDFIYSMTFRGKEVSTVEGVSIDGAMILARNYMNCATECEVVEEGPTHWIFKATFIDHETGFTEARLFRQNKKQRSMKGDADRALDIAFQIGQSKAKRNAIVRAMPTWLVTKAVEAAKASAAAKIKDLPEAIENAVKAFNDKYQVGQQRLETYIGAPRAQWNARDVVRLRATFKALVDRQTTVANEFPVEEAAPAETQAKPADEGMLGDQAKPKPVEQQNVVTGQPKVEPSSPAQPATPTAEPPKEPVKAAEPPKSEPKKDEKKPTREPGED